MKIKLLYFLIIAVPVFLIDHITKLFASKYLDFFTIKEIIPGFFNFILVHNKGAAFGMFANRTTITSTIIFYSLTIIAIVILIELLIKTPTNKKLYMISYNMILGGALGNLYDRIFQGFVVDFLDFYHKSYHWATFNVADAVVVIGTGLLITAIFIYDEDNNEGVKS